MLTVDRLRWGIPIIGGDGWIGGSIYLENLVAAVRTLPVDEQPQVSLLMDDPAARIPPGLQAGSTQMPLYPSLLACRFIRILRRQPITFRVAASSPLTRTERQACGQLDVVFPCSSPFQIQALHKAAGWIADFQHIHLPQNFSSLERRRRDRDARGLAAQLPLVVLSSEDARKDFESLCPGYAHKARILNFATVPQRNWFTGDPECTARKYGLPDVFAMIPNQFWVHKNHLCAFEALRIMKRHARTIHLVCTGFTGDYRNKHYFDRVKAYLRAHDLEQYVHVLGLIPRADQIQLLRRAAVVIQPSLFEGWSTVVEDARLFGKRLIVSDIAVHREQNVAGALYFDPRAPADLADLLMSQLPILRPGPDMAEEAVRSAQHDRITTFARTFLQIAREIATMRTTPESHHGSRDDVGRFEVA